MKTKTLIYDDNCPLCTWYSGLFVKYGLIPAEGRRSFSDLDPVYLASIDFNRGRNEIPLLDRETGHVLYGIDALVEIISQRFPIVRRIAKNSMMYWFLKKLYKLISYNRKVIVAKKCSESAIDCAPDLNFFYRTLFMVIGLAFNTILLYPIHDHFFSKLPFYELSIGQLQTAHFALVASNCILSLRFTWSKRFEYLGQVNMLALLVILSLLPITIVSSFIDLSNPILTIYLVFTALFIFREYLRRMEYTGMLNRNKWLVSANIASLIGFILYIFN